MQLGHIVTATMKMSQPPMNFEDVGFNRIMILTGQNGSGKSMLLKTQYAMNSLANIIILTAGKGGDFIGLAQYFFDGTFEDLDFTGDIIVNYNNMNSLSVTLSNGKVTECIPIIDANIDEPTPVIFMSKSMRTFDEIKMYLKIRKTSVDDSEPHTLENMRNFYKLYDISYVEGLIGLVGAGLKVTEGFNKTMETFELTKLDIASFHYSKADSEFYYKNSKNEKKSLNALSAGEQSLINMFIMQTMRE